MSGRGGLSVQWGMLCVLLGFAFVLLAILGFAHAYSLEEEVRDHIAASCSGPNANACGAKPLSGPAAGYLSASVTERYISSGLLVSGALLFCIGYWKSRSGNDYGYRPPRY
ncbi:MAG TPA: hypothetical protein VNZ52_12640 [Candidatus Thermoplasmatota archaeon]|nr:hypothetical protein [Candidatus Thermoplasmatota archaeon]